MIFVILDLRVAEVVLKRRFKLLSFFYNNYSSRSHAYVSYDHTIADESILPCKRRFSLQTTDQLETLGML